MSDINEMKKDLKKQLRKSFGKEVYIPTRLMKEINSLLGIVNSVTCPHRHGTKIRERDLTRLCNKQLDVEELLREYDLS